MSSMQESAPQEQALRGWSAWEVLALGYDKTLLPKLGAGLLRLPNLSLEGKLMAISLLRLGFDWTLLEEDTPFTPEQFYKENQREAKLLEDGTQALLWCSVFPRLPEVRDEEGRPLLTVLSEALVYFGTYELHGWPDSGAYQGEERGYERWREDCVFYGRLLAGSPEDRSRGLIWLSEWFPHLWD